MSLEASTWVRKHAPTKNPTEQVILMMLADRANDDGTGAWPYYARLAEESRCSLPTVKRVMRELENRGLIKRGDQSKVAGYPNDRKPVVWDLNMSLDRQKSTRCQNDTPLNSDERGIRFDRTRYQIHHNEVSDSTGRGITSDTRNPHNHPRTIQEPSNNAQHPVERERQGYPAEFEEWWATYPRKVGKGKAVKDWRRAMKRTDNQTLIDASRRLAAFHEAEGTDPRFIPHPSTWLNRDGWEDDLTPSQPQRGVDGTRPEDWAIRRGEPMSEMARNIDRLFGHNINVIEGECWEEQPKEIGQ